MSSCFHYYFVEIFKEYWCNWVFFLSLQLSVLSLYIAFHISDSILWEKRRLISWHLSVAHKYSSQGNFHEKKWVEYGRYPTFIFQFIYSNLLIISWTFYLLCLCDYLASTAIYFIQETCLGFASLMLRKPYSSCSESGFLHPHDWIYDQHEIEK